MKLRLFALLFWLIASPACAADFSFDGYGDLRLIVPPTQGSYYDGDLGKLRFGYDDGKVTAKVTDLVGEARVLVTPELLITATGRINPEYGPAADLVEGYVRYRPVSTSHWRWAIKAGAFFPPGSLENDQIGWTSAWTITPSAINSWIGYEIRIIGTEGAVEWRRDDGTLTLTGALYGWNDPAGVLIADRGWSLDDRVSGIFEHEREPDALGVEFHETPPLHAELFRQIGNSPGWYASVAWSEPGLGDFSLVRYDNNADPAAFADGQFAWRTKYWNAGFRKQIDNITLLAQALTGSTEIRPAPSIRSITNFSSAYALAGLDLGDWRFAGRVDVFRTHTQATIPSLSSENGCAGTLAATWFPTDWLQLTNEFILLKSDRNQRILVGEAAQDAERQFQFLARVFF